MNQPLNKDKTYIEDILNACRKCFSFTKDMNFAEFEKDELSVKRQKD